MMINEEETTRTARQRLLYSLLALSFTFDVVLFFLALHGLEVGALFAREETFVVLFETSDLETKARDGRQRVFGLRFALPFRFEYGHFFALQCELVVMRLHGYLAHGRYTPQHTHNDEWSE